MVAIEPAQLHTPTGDGEAAPADWGGGGGGVASWLSQRLVRSIAASQCCWSFSSPSLDHVTPFSCSHTSPSTSPERLCGSSRTLGGAETSLTQGKEMTNHLKNLLKIQLKNRLSLTQGSRQAAASPASCDDVDLHCGAHLTDNSWMNMKDPHGGSVQRKITSILNL